MLSLAASQAGDWIEVLACVGILKASKERPIKATHDWYYAESWRGEDRYDSDAVKSLFGSWLAPPS